MKADVLVIGAGPAGYPAAFRLAAAGKRVVIADPESLPGGVCLHRGCIPSKALLHAAGTVTLATAAEAMGIRFAPPQIDLDALRRWGKEIVDRHATALARQMKRLRITHVQGRAQLLDAHTAEFDAGTDDRRIEFDHAIVATGSLPVDPGFGAGTARVMDSTGALALTDIPTRLLVIGGGYIGLELGQAYAGLGSRVSVVEMTDSLLPGVDADLVAPLASRMGGTFEAILLGTKVADLSASEASVTVRFEGRMAPTEPQTYDRVLVAVGRKPVSAGLGLEAAGVAVDGRGFVTVDAQRRTSQASIYAVGDVAGQPMLAHKATREGHTAADAILGRRAAFEPQAIPAVVFTDPEIAWCGLTEAAAKADGRAVRVGRFPWSASGRASTQGRTDGVTKVLAEPDTGRVLGVGLAGPGAGELIAEAVLAIEMGAVAEDLALTIHPHPTLSETLMEAAATLAIGAPRG